mmetsp:Transcript_7873/g.20994  ORF Transcript_7873/g.20994 Transcript_7873/m.20994 type:complete len:209 (+) Transcript_7873:331-957(+)
MVLPLSAVVKAAASRLFFRRATRQRRAGVAASAAAVTATAAAAAGVVVASRTSSASRAVGPPVATPAVSSASTMQRLLSEAWSASRRTTVPKSSMARSRSGPATSTETWTPTTRSGAPRRCNAPPPAAHLAIASHAPSGPPRGDNRASSCPARPPNSPRSVSTCRPSRWKRGPLPVDEAIWGENQSCAPSRAKQCGAPQRIARVVVRL